MKEHRCPTCNRLLAKFQIEGKLKLEIKCKKCGTVTTLVMEVGKDENSSN